MSWGSAFVADLASGRSDLRWYVTVWPNATGIGSAFTAGSDAALCDDAAMGVRALSTMGQSLALRSWDATLGGFSFQALGDLGTAARCLPRGAMVALYVGFAGYTRTQFERVAVGSVVDVQGVVEGRGVVALLVSVHDLPVALRGRQTADTGAHPLFYQTSATTTLTATEAVASATYDVASTANFDYPTSGTYPHGYIYVETSAGDAYFRRATVASGTTLAITDAATVGIVGTTDAGASSGDTVREAWGLRGHPLDIVRQLLVSRGDGLGGPWDVYPAAWGYRISANLVDMEDIALWRAHALLTPSSGSYEWEIAGVDPIEDGWSWLSGLLAESGFFFAMRQGSLTCRPVQNPRGLHVAADISLTDDDLDHVVRYEAWAATVPEETYYAEVVTYTSGAFTSGSVRMTSLPGRHTYSYSQRAVMFNNGTANAAVDLARLGLCVHVVPEVVGLRLAGLRAAGLTLGDLVTLTTDLVPSRSLLEMRGRTGMVIGHRVDWLAGGVDLELATWPSEEEA